MGGKVKELCRKIRRYQIFLRAFLEKKGNYSLACKRGVRIRSPKFLRIV
jgi:hypothetical protein